METYAPGGAGVHLEHTPSLGDERLVAVPVDDDPCAGARGRVDQSKHKMQQHALQIHVHPQWQDGELVLTLMPAVGGVLVPFEVPDPTPCCADH